MKAIKTSDDSRSSFSSKLGFIFAAAGSAVGLGNIWRFPYLAAEYGGGIFLLVYALLSITFGFCLMVAEIAIGRKTGLSTIGAFRSLDKRFTFVGYIASAVPLLILPYYSVIGGWVMKYMINLISSGNAMAQDGYFTGYVSEPWEPLLWFLLFLFITTLVVILGVEKGIEKVSKIMMPLLIILILIITIYTVASLDGALEGVIYYLKPDFSKFSVMTVVAATGQLFYSMSLAMGTMITFGSYMKKDISIESSAHNIEFIDLGIAFLSGLMIIPAVFAFSGGDESALGEGPGLMFVTLPKIFNSMPGGAFIGTIFFIMVFFAALTSSVALMETIVSVLMDKLKLSRAKSCLVTFGFALLLGVPSSLGYGALAGVKILGLGILDFFVFLSNNVMMPVVALISSIFVGYVLGPKTVIDEIEVGGRFKAKPVFSPIIKYFAPVFILIILASSILDVLGIVTI